MKWVTPVPIPDGYNHKRARRKPCWRVAGGSHLQTRMYPQEPGDESREAEAQGETLANVTSITACERKARPCGITFDYAKKTNPVFNFRRWRL